MSTHFLLPANHSTHGNILLCSVGGGSIWFAGSGHVSLESAGSAGSFYVLLAGAVCTADLHLLQLTGPAPLQREAALPVSHQV